jgi:translocation protein SEC63
LEQLARLKEEDRRSVLHHLNDEQYQNVIKVLGSMPYIDMDIKYEVVDDEATTVYTAGAIVTVGLEHWIERGLGLIFIPFR